MKIIQDLSPWQTNRPLKLNYKIKRAIFEKLKKDLDSKKISLLLGARQVGKTTLMMAQIDYLLKKKKVNPLAIYYINFDYLELQKFKNAIEFLQQFKIDKEKPHYLFMDEIQRLEEPGLFLKQLSDLKQPLKIIASGSSSLEIKSKVKESLTGRKKVFEIFPITFQEFLNYKYPAIIPDQNIFHEYLTFGGYPEAVTSESVEEKIEIIREIVHSYFQKDVTDFLKIQYPNKYNDLIKILSSQIGSLINTNELSNTINMHNKTVEDYLYYMQETYLIDFLKPFHRNIRKEISKQKKGYFVDPGIRNYFLNNFSDIHLHNDYGSLVENFIYLQLKQKYEADEIYFWRTSNKTEIDFITIQNEKFELFEVKAKPYSRLKAIKNFDSFEKTYPVESKNVFCFIDKKIKKKGIRFKNIWSETY